MKNLIMVDQFVLFLSSIKKTINSKNDLVKNIIKLKVYRLRYSVNKGFFVCLFDLLIWTIDVYTPHLFKSFYNVEIL